MASKPIKTKKQKSVLRSFSILLLATATSIFGFQSCKDKTFKTFEGNTPIYQTVEDWRNTSFVLQDPEWTCSKIRHKKLSNSTQNMKGRRNGVRGLKLLVRPTFHFPQPDISNTASSDWQIPFLFPIVVPQPMFFRNRKMATSRKCIPNRCIRRHHSGKVWPASCRAKTS